jgi:hypothetical protein
MRMYSKYPTDINKYECRIGSFEGFFVSSVEFYKFNKFDKDDRKDLDGGNNQTGTQCPIDPQSSNRMYSTSIYSVLGKLSSTLNFGHAASIAIYNSRDTVEWKLCHMNPGNASFVLDNALIGQDRWLIRISGPAKNVEAAV